MRLRYQALALGSAVMLGASALLSLSQTALATTLQVKPANIETEGVATQLPLQKVGHTRRHNRILRRQGGRRAGVRRGGRRQFGYNPGRHGPRYRRRSARNRYQYGGYWYGFPFWLGAAALAGAYNNPYYDPYYDPYYAEPAPVADGHVTWCLHKYRSYNPRTDSFRGFDGYDHPCVSPFSY